MNKITPAGKKQTVYEGTMFEMVKQPMNVGSKIIEFETVRRAPGTRIIIIKDNKILITKEYRTELNNYDYRLPGGKVFDTLKEYNNSLKNNTNILESATKAAKKECLEETGLIVNDLELLKISKCGATIDWDMYYFLAQDIKESKTGQTLEAGEIITVNWYSFKQAKQLCLNNKIQEDRTLGVLLAFLEKNK